MEEVDERRFVIPEDRRIIRLESNTAKRNLPRQRHAFSQPELSGTPDLERGEESGGRVVKVGFLFKRVTFYMRQ